MCNLTVIVPVYNVEQYVEKCLQTIVCQTIKPYEVLLINDGSTDGSRGICQKFCNEYSFIKIIDQENKGLSEARNAGLDHSTGDYVIFIDSDDYVSLNMFEVLLKHINTKKASIVKCGIYNHIDNSTIERVNTISSKEVVLRDKIYMFKYLFTKKMSHSVCNAIYDADLFKDLRFERGKIMEDAFITPHLIIACEKLVLISDFMYYYRQRKGSIMHSFNHRHFNYLESAQNFKTILKNNHKFELLYDDFYIWYGRHLKNILKNMAINSSYFSYRRYIKKMSKYIDNNDYNAIINSTDKSSVANKTVRRFKNTPSFFWLSENFKKHKKSVMCVLSK